jgi:hypothetical protein
MRGYGNTRGGYNTATRGGRGGGYPTDPWHMPPGMTMDHMGMPPAPGYLGAGPPGAHMGLGLMGMPPGMGGGMMGMDMFAAQLPPPPMQTNWNPYAGGTTRSKMGTAPNAPPQQQQQHQTQKLDVGAGDAVGSGATVAAKNHTAVGGSTGYHRVPLECVTVSPHLGLVPPLNEMHLRFATKQQLDTKWMEFDAVSPADPTRCSVRVAVRRPVAGTLPNRPKG